MTATLTPTPRRWAPKLLQQQEFRRYWSAQTISLFGDQVSMLALPLLAVLGASAGPAEMGYLTAAWLIPNLLFSLVAGAWADRQPSKRKIMIIADIARAVLTLLVPVLYLMDMLSMTQLYVVVFLIGTFSLLFEVCRETLFASLVSKDEYLSANALLNGSRALSFVAGPSVGGILVQLVRAPFALVLDGLSYLASAAFLAKVKPVEPPPSESKGFGLFEGMRFVFQSKVIRAQLAAATTLNLFNYMFSALFILYATIHLGISPGVLGVAFGVASLGSLLGAAITGRVAARIGVGPTFILGLIMFPAPLVLIPLASGSMTTIVTMLVVAEFLSGMGVMLIDIVGGSIRTAAVPADLRARVGGAYRTVNYGIRPIGALLGGLLGSSSLGVHNTLWIATVGAIAGVLWVFASPIPKMREL